MTGRYRIRLSALSVWVGPQKGKRWYRPDINVVSRGRRSEPVKVYAQRPPRQIRHLGEFDATPDVSVGEFDVYLVEGETIRVDASRLFRSRPPSWHNPLAEEDGQPGVAFRWLEVEGPLLEGWPSAGGGTVDTFTVYGEGDDRRVLALVRVDGADGGLVHWIGGCDAEEVEIGMRVKAVVEPKGKRTGGLSDIRHFAPDSSRA